MSGIKYLPDNKENKLYSPMNIRELIIKAKVEAGSDDAFYNNPKNKKLIEMQYASALAVAIYSSTGDKYYLYPFENPDIHFIEQKGVDKHQIGFSVEIMTLFDYNSRTFNQNYDQLADLVWQKKGKVDYDRTELLLISRLNCWFDIDKFINAMEKFNWIFLRIWLGVYKSGYKWNFFKIIFPQGEENAKMFADLNNIFY